MAPGGQGQPPSSAGLVVKGKAPVSNDILKVKLPKPQEADLPNGLHLMVLEDHRLPRVAFQIIIPGAGGYFDPPAMIGLSTYTAQMMREGTTTQIVAADLAGARDDGGERDRRQQPVRAVRDRVRRRADREPAAAVRARGRRPAQPVVPGRRVGAAEGAHARRARSSSGRSRGSCRPSGSRRSIFGDHPAGRISATPETLDAITRDAMVEFHRTRFVPDHALIAFAGDITLADARKMVEAKLGGVEESRRAEAGDRREPPAPGRRRCTSSRRPDSVQTSLAVGTQSMVRTDPDYVPLTVANRVLGGTMGRLFRHLREEKGYTYGIGSGFSATDIRGQWSASTSVRTEVTEPALTDLLAEIAEMRDKPVPESELRTPSARSSRASRCRSRTRRRCSATTCRTGCTGCRPTTGTPIRRRSAP